MSYTLQTLIAAITLSFLDDVNECYQVTREALGVRLRFAHSARVGC